ncbi:MAG: hypothetical protein P8M79_12080 [Alphaproteobacteria bacterium]|nr:hypothetical protein [Alphaproteobacteria bacterium]
MTLEFQACIWGCAGDSLIVMAKPYKLASDGGVTVLSLRQRRLAAAR